MSSPTYPGDEDIVLSLDCTLPPSLVEHHKFTLAGQSLGKMNLSWLDIKRATYFDLKVDGKYMCGLRTPCMEALHDYEWSPAAVGTASYSELNTAEFALLCKLHEAALLLAHRWNAAFIGRVEEFRTHLAKRAKDLNRQAKIQHGKNVRKGLYATRGGKIDKKRR